MKLSTGKIEFPIEFDNGDKQSIYFNPNDTDLPNRLKDFKTRVDNRLKEQNINLQDETGDYFEVITETNKIVQEEIDVVFGNKISDVVFMYCKPFDIVDGQFFLLQFLDAITPEIEKHIKEANKSLEKNINKYIGKYQKK